MKTRTAIHVTDLPELDDGSSLKMVFAAKCPSIYRSYLLASDLTDATDAGAVRLLEWMRENKVDLIYE